MERWIVLCCAVGALWTLAACEEDEPAASGQPDENNAANNSAANNADDNNGDDNNADENNADDNNDDDEPDASDEDDAKEDPRGEDVSEEDTGEEDTGEEPDAELDAEEDVGEEPDAEEDAPDEPDPMIEDPPQELGPWRRALVEATVTRGDREIPVVAHLPLNFGGEAPLVVFVPGFQLDSFRYAPLCEHLASHGFVVVRADPPDPLFGVSHAEMAEDVSEVLDWATDPEGELGGLVDEERVGVMGHSLGGKVSAMAASQDERVGALLGIDPVNAGSPLTGFTEDLPDILPEWLQDLTTPMGFMGETFNAVGIGPACAPADGNFMQFYAAGGASDWLAAWDFVGADHIDFVDDREGCPFTACNLCPDGPADDATIPPKMHTLAAAFFRLHLAGDLEVEPWLDGAQLPEAVTVSRPE